MEKPPFTTRVKDTIYQFLGPGLRVRLWRGTSGRLLHKVYGTHPALRSDLILKYIAECDPKDEGTVDVYYKGGGLRIRVHGPAQDDNLEQRLRNWMANH
jgi:hypothetical protein